jgi:hypothetical protein
MTGRPLKRYARPALVYHFINLCTYFLYKCLRIFKPVKSDATGAQPLLITGLFRSGTTVTARIIKDMGFSAGPDDHLLKAIGSRKWLNPDGFLENHFFMELSMYLFYKTNTWGDTPPSKVQVESLSLNKQDDDEMVRFSIVELHEDRISNVNKLKVQLNASASQPQYYVSKYFSGKTFIKNPHFCVLFPYFRRLFPASDILVVFRHPADAVKSARNVSPFADYNLYEAYYRELCDEFRSGNNRVHFFSYDNLINDTQNSILKLAGFLKLNSPPEIDYIRTKQKDGVSEPVPENAMMLFNYMRSNCINA